MVGQRWFVISALGFLAIGCGDGGDCDDLRAVCDSCPDTPEGRKARVSCESTLSSGDPLACEDRLEAETYQALGCNP